MTPHFVLKHFNRNLKIMLNPLFYGVKFILFLTEFFISALYNQHIFL